VKSRRLPGMLILAGAAAACYLFWFWREQSRPGMGHYLRGMDYLVARDPLRAESEWLLGVKEDPTEYHCYAQLGDYYSEVRHLPAAAECYAIACRLAPHNGSLFLRLAAVEKELGRADPARAAAQRASQLLPNNAEALGLYGTLLAESRSRPAALAALRRAHALAPENRDYLIALVNTELDSFNYAGVEQDLAPYLRTHPNDAEACYMMAVVYNQKPRTPQNLHTAIDFAQRALAGIPADARAYTVLGQLYLDAGRPRDALRVCTAGRRAAPHAEGNLRALMDCYTRLGQSAERASVAAALQKVLARHDRINHLTSVMSFDHQNTAAGLELAHLEEEEGRYARAQAFYEQLVRQAPDDPRLRHALSGFYQRRGSPDKARRALRPQFIP
jgi:cytochrome c-type biogenesis protein CcmH/NrfG